MVVFGGYLCPVSYTKKYINKNARSYSKTGRVQVHYRHAQDDRYSCSTCSKKAPIVSKVTPIISSPNTGNARQEMKVLIEKMTVESDDKK